MYRTPPQPPMFYALVAVFFLQFPHFFVIYPLPVIHNPDTIFTFYIYNKVNLLYNYLLEKIYFYNGEKYAAEKKA